MQRLKKISKLTKGQRFDLDISSPCRVPVDSSRLSRFTEERHRYRVPLLRKGQKAVAATFSRERLHVLTQSPVALHAFEDGGHMHSVCNLHALSPWTGPAPCLSSLGDGSVAAYVPSVGSLLRFDWDARIGYAYSLPATAQSQKIQMAGGGAGMVILHEVDGRICHTFDFDRNELRTIEFDVNVSKVIPLSSSMWQVDVHGPEAQTCVIMDVEDYKDGKVIPMSSLNEFILNRHDANDSTPAHLPREDGVSRMFLSASPRHHYCSAVGMREVFEAQRLEPLIQEDAGEGYLLPRTGQVAVIRNEMDEMEIMDTKQNMFRILPLQCRDDRVVDAVELGDGSLSTVQESGLIRTFTVSPDVLKEELRVWRAMFGMPEPEPEPELGLKSEFSSHKSTAPPPLEAPKFGKAPDGKAHVGGSTWAGGTGGSNTAGLGGRGGPYRLDGGFPVHQVSDELKDEVSEEAKQLARQMAQEAFEERLREIDMDGHENEVYEKYYGRVSDHVSRLQKVLGSLRASRSKERTWIKNQSSGEIDDNKLIDGATGEKLIYKRRLKSNYSISTPRVKHIRFVMDVSGSMYRFNGYDGRLDRLLESTLLILNAFQGADSKKMVYSIVGHSGDGPAHMLVDRQSPPENKKEQLQVLQRMVAHSQFCMSGDHTVEAVEVAVEQLARENDAEEKRVVMVSDANLQRYGISPDELAEKLTANEDVDARAIFIASLGDEADRITQSLPRGQAHVCMDTGNLPEIFQRMLRDDLFLS
eukprot:g1342.t1